MNKPDLTCGACPFHSLTRKGRQCVVTECYCDRQHPCHASAAELQRAIDALRVHHREPRTVFVGSMCDLWSEGVEQAWRTRIYAAIEAVENPDSAFVVLTKSPQNITEEDRRGWPAKLWVGASLTGGPVAEWEHPDRDEMRWNLLCRSVPPERRILCAEPLLGSVWESAGIPIGKSDIAAWIIIGPQTGGGAVRPERWWIKELVTAGKDWDIPVWMKPACVDPRWGYPDLELVRQKPEGVP